MKTQDETLVPPIKKWYAHRSLQIFFALLIATITFLSLSGYLYDTGPIAQACASERKISRDYVLGEVLVMFPSSTSIDEIYSFINDGGYKILRDFSLYKPTELGIHWASSFIDKNEVTLDEVNSFLDRAIKEPYVEHIVAHGLWNPHPSQASDNNHVRAIDRWGFFTVTFKEEDSKAQFFKSYPEATFFGDGLLAGQTFFKRDGVHEAVVLYKAQPALDILQKIRAHPDIRNAQEERGRGAIGSDGDTQQPRLEFFPREGRGFSSTTFVMNIPARTSNIKDILASYPDIDTSLTFSSTTVDQDQKFNLVTIRVPIGKEQCYAAELSKLNNIEWASTNNLGIELD